VASFERPTICIVKHLSPCGVASGDALQEAFQGALASDPVSAFGGVIAANRPFDLGTARSLGDLFVECIIAPGFTPEARASLAKRVNLRLVSMPSTQVAPLFELRSVNQGVLRQSLDLGDPPGTEWKAVTTRQSTVAEWQALRFAWKVCQHVKSNAIVFARGEATVGIGGGQPNRVDCVRIAAARAGEKARGAVMASDAFFPFPDSVEVAAKAGITAIAAPGGSVRDADAIAAADATDIAMLWTAVRHFRH
jgi:phosphoribosylaminoimidazolecarboxamide formyltransferase/IMP cyclohydrolase